MCRDSGGISRLALDDSRSQLIHRGSCGVTGEGYVHVRHKNTRVRHSAVQTDQVGHVYVRHKTHAVSQALSRAESSGRVRSMCVTRCTQVSGTQGVQQVTQGLTNCERAWRRARHERVSARTISAAAA